MSAAKKKPQQRSSATEASQQAASPATIEIVTDYQPVVESITDSEAILRVGDAVLPFRIEGSEPLIRDEDFAMWLGFERPRKIRDLIKRMERAGKLSNINHRPTVGRRAEGQVAARPTTEYWLTKTQALLVATQSDTPRAWALTETIVRVFESVTKRPEALTREVMEREFMTGESRARELTKLAKLAAGCGKQFSFSSEQDLFALALEIAKGSACYGGIGRDLGSTTMEQFQAMRSTLIGCARWALKLSKPSKRLQPGRRKQGSDGQPMLPLSATFELPSASITVTVEPREAGQ